MAHYPKAPAPPTPALLRQPKGKLTLKIPGHIWNSVTPEPAQPAPADAPEVQEGANVFKFAIPGAKLADWEKKRVGEGAEKQEKKKTSAKDKGPRKVVGKDAAVRYIPLYHRIPPRSRITNTTLQEPKPSPLPEAAPRTHPARGAAAPSTPTPRRRPRNVHHELMVRLSVSVLTSLFPAAEDTHVSMPRPQESTLDRVRR